MIDEIDAFARGSKGVDNSSMRKSMAPVHSFREFLKELISRGRQKDSQKVADDTLAKSLSRKRVEATNSKVKGLTGIESEKRAFSLSIVGIANSVELFKGEVGKGGSMQAVRQSQATCEVTEDEEEKGSGVDEDASYLLRQSSLLSKNEVKVLFRPYTRDNLQKILHDLFLQHIQ